MSMSVEHKVVSPRLLHARVLKEFPTHDAIYSLVRGKDQRIYFALCAEVQSSVTAKLFAYSPSTGRYEQLADIGEVTGDRPENGMLPHSKIHLSMEVGNDGKLYCATHITAPPVGETFLAVYENFRDPRRGYPGAKIIMYDPESRRAECLGNGAPYEGCRVMTMDKDRELLYLVSYPRSHLFRFDIRKRVTTDLGRISNDNPMGIVCDRRGFVYTTDDDGYMLRYHPDKGELERLSVQLPDAHWRGGRGNYVRRMILSPDGSAAWGFGAKSVASV